MASGFLIFVPQKLNTTSEVKKENYSETFDQIIYNFKVEAVTIEKF